MSNFFATLFLLLLILLGRADPIHFENLPLEGDFLEFEKEQKARDKAAREFNATVADEEILGFLKFKYQDDPQNLKEIKLREADPVKRKLLLENERRSAEELAVKLDTLRGLTDAQKVEMSEMFRMIKKLHDEAVAAGKQLEPMPEKDVVLVHEVAIEQIDKYRLEFEEDVFKDRIVLNKVPKRLDHLEISSVYVSKNSCAILLHNGMGKDIGYNVGLTRGKWVVSSYNEYKSWDWKKVVFSDL